MVLATCVLQVP